MMKRGVTMIRTYWIFCYPCVDICRPCSEICWSSEETYPIVDPFSNPITCQCIQNCLFEKRWKDRSERLFGANREILLHELRMTKFSESPTSVEFHPMTPGEFDFWTTLEQTYRIVQIYEDPVLRVREISPTGRMVVYVGHGEFTSSFPDSNVHWI